MAEFSKDYRPNDFDEVVGQEDAVRVLRKYVENDKLPHAIMFTGPSGTGKTTLARILRNKLDCKDSDFSEVNNADVRGIDSIRDIRNRMMLKGLGGKTRVWLFDEAHQMTKDAQNALLKILEDTPRHVYFFLATTEPNKLLKTIVTRCTEIKCRELSKTEICDVLDRVVQAEDLKIHDDVLTRIVEASDGSARKALVLLDSVALIKDHEEQLAAVVGGNFKAQAYEIGVALLYKRVDWPGMVKILEAVDEDAEGLRRLVLAMAAKVLLKGGKGAARAAAVADEFRDHFYDCGRPGLVLACYRVIAGG